MKTIFMFLAMFTAFLPMHLMAEDTQHGENTFKIQAWDFSDPTLDAVKGGACGEFLSYLMESGEKYGLLDTTGVTGPPGVVYTLQNYKGEIAILKCGAAGGCSHEEGGEDQ